MHQILRLRTGINDVHMISLAVKMVRTTRENPDIKLGASIRAAIDLVDLFVGMQKLEDQHDKTFLIAARMAMSNKILLNEMTDKTADEIIEGIWERLKTKAKPLTSGKENYDDTDPIDQQSQEKNLEEEKKEAKKKILM